MYFGVFNMVGWEKSSVVKHLPGNQEVVGSNPNAVCNKKLDIRKGGGGGGSSEVNHLPGNQEVVGSNPNAVGKKK